MTDQMRYLTDDRDERNPNEIIITQGGNGDWYVATAPKGQGALGKAVRICTSGGASTRCPGLAPAIANAFRAIAKAREVYGDDL